MNEPDKISYCSCVLIEEGEVAPPDPGNSFLNSLGKIKPVKLFTTIL